MNPPSLPIASGSFKRSSVTGGATSTTSKPPPHNRHLRRSNSELVPWLTATLTSSSSTATGSTSPKQMTAIPPLKEDAEEGSSMGEGTVDSTTTGSPATVGVRHRHSHPNCLQRRPSRLQSSAALLRSCEPIPEGDASLPHEGHEGDDLSRGPFIHGGGIGGRRTRCGSMAPSSAFMSSSTNAFGTPPQQASQQHPHSKGSSISGRGGSSLAEFQQLLSQCKNCKKDYQCDCCSKCNHLLFFYSPVGDGQGAKH